MVQLRRVIKRVIGHDGAQSSQNGSSVTLHWFRRDLRLGDNPALSWAAQHGDVLPLFIHDDRGNETRMEGASCWWLHQSLQALNHALGDRLCLTKGCALEVIPRLLAETGISRVSWNRVWEPVQDAQDAQLLAILERANISTHVDNDSLLWSPEAVLKKDGTPYRVFTPYYRKGCLGGVPPRYPLSEPEHMQIWQHTPAGEPLARLKLMPEVNWYAGLARRWQPGEFGARVRLADFIRKSLSGYQQYRDSPAADRTSKLSAHLHFGEVSPHQVWYLVQQHAAEHGLTAHKEHFLRELAWREFSYYLLHHFPDLPYANFRKAFDRFPWLQDEDKLRCWQRGTTGVPLVDAGMRELWQTGFMHNRVRMVCASYLVKNLLQDWRKGAAWFAGTLVDADLACNSASWQWIAGSGVDAAPYFRIFNPVSQGKKFDPQGEYVRRYVPELSALPNRWLHEPWNAPEAELGKAGIELGIDYPEPLVDLSASRKQALKTYQLMRSTSAVGTSSAAYTA